jgi:hypothetical protein
MDIFGWFEDKVLGWLGDWLMKVSGIDSLINAPIKALASLVSGGSIWRGRGADKFVAELTGNTTKELQHIENLGKSFHAAVKQASDTILGAMQSATQLVQSLAEDVDNI